MVDEWLKKALPLIAIPGCERFQSNPIPAPSQTSNRFGMSSPSQLSAALLAATPVVGVESRVISGSILVLDLIAGVLLAVISILVSVLIT